MAFEKQPLLKASARLPPTIGQWSKPFLELIRFEKPTGTILMFWPFAWGHTAGAQAINLPVHSYISGLLLWLLGAFLIRGSACTVNDILDRNLDANVERTRTRPLPSGRVSLLSATLWLFLQYVAGFFFFYLATDGPSLYIGLFQLYPLFAIYPLLKRITYWPQAWLGLAMNFGFVTSWFSLTSRWDWQLLILTMMGCWCWTVLYDTVYACQDMKDDVVAKIHSTAILFGSRIKLLLAVCVLGFIGCLAAAGWVMQQGWIFFAVSIGGTAVHFLWQFAHLDLSSPSSCALNFKQNGVLGSVVFLGLLLEYLVTFAK